MSNAYRPYDFPEYVEPAQKVWDAIAKWWDDKIGDGNVFQIELIEPATHRLLDIAPGERVIDIACGTGRLTRQIADAGASVVAIDHSFSFIKRAKERSKGYKNRIDFRVINAADGDELSALGEGSFNAAVCTMALMDMAVISTPIANLAKLLKPGGRAVFSVTHPAFNSSDFRIEGSAGDFDGRYTVNHRASISKYAPLIAYRGEGIVGQPVAQWYFHRSMETLLSAWFEHGFVLDGIEEPTLSQSALEGSRPRVLSWANLPEVPPILVARMRLP